MKLPTPVTRPAALLLSLLASLLFLNEVYAQSPLCESVASDQSHEWVTRLKIGDQEVTSGKTGYADFTANPMLTVEAGQTYAVEVDVHTDGNTYLEYVNIWLDLNQDLSIDNVTERVYSESANVTTFLMFTGTLTIPEDAFNGIMYGRMIMQFNANPNLCGTYTYGTTYDFRFQVIGGEVNPEQSFLTVSAVGNGNVVSNPPGIDTSSGITSANFNHNQDVTLVATPAGENIFQGWSGDATGAATSVVVNMGTADKAVTATFLALPSVAPTTTSDLTSSSVVANGNVMSEGDEPVTARGFVLGTANNPMIGGGGVTQILSGAGSGLFTEAFTGLTPGVTYYVRSYATSGVGTTYGTTATFTTPKLDQTITFNEIASPQTYGDAAFTLEATASSGLPVALVSNDPDVATVTGSLVTIFGVGTVTLTASQSGSATYDAAPPVERSFVVNPKELTIIGLSVEDKIFDGTTDVTVNGTPELFGVVEGDTVSLSGSPLFTFIQKEVGSHVSVLTEGYVLTGDNAPDYSLTLPILSAHIFPGSPAVLEMLQQPGLTVAGVRLENPSVLALDVFGNPVAAGYTIGVSLLGTAFNDTSTTTALTDSSGIATFSNLIIEQAGEGYELSFEVIAD